MNTLMPNPPLLTQTASVKERHYFIFHDAGLPTIRDAVTGRYGKHFPAGQIVDVIGQRIVLGNSLIRIRGTQYHSWLETKRLQLHVPASQH